MEKVGADLNKMRVKSRANLNGVKTTHERCGPFSPKDEVEFTTVSGYPAKTLSETLSSKLQLNTFKSPKD